MTGTDTVASHYSAAGLLDRVTGALDAAGLVGNHLSPGELAPLDQFHTRGLAATAGLAAQCDLDATTAVLDIGSGLGGPSRYLAATYGCHVTGVDLSPDFVEVATSLATRTGLDRLVGYRRADALALPFEADAFDLVWTQHVAMNITDRPRLHAEIHRVLKPGGRLAVYDVVAGPSGGSLHFPVPWATTAATSSLVSPADMRAMMEAAGFDVLVWDEPTSAALAWFEANALAGAREPSPLSLASLMGPGFSAAAANLRRNLIEGHAGLVQAVLRRD